MRQFFAVMLYGASIFLILFGTLSQAEVERPLSPAQEAVLFSLADLGPVDLAPKRVTLEVFIAPQPDLHPFHRLLPQAWPRVQDFYARMGVLVTMTPGQQLAGPLEPGKRLRLEVLTRKEWLAKSFDAWNLEPPHRQRFFRLWDGQFAFAHLNLSTIHFSFKPYQDAVFKTGPGAEKQNICFLANLIIHELGHLFGLYHAHEFDNDPIPEMLPDGKTPNFMSFYLTAPVDLGFVDFQQRLVHSYLGGGKVFRQYRQVDFDASRYLELIKEHNNYREPSEGKSRRGEKTRIAAFGDYETEDDEEDDEEEAAFKREMVSGDRWE